jgi:hypothetical protein
VKKDNLEYIIAKTKPHLDAFKKKMIDVASTRENWKLESSLI